VDAKQFSNRLIEKKQGQQQQQDDDEGILKEAVGRVNG
jgi:hypothetical protein